MFTRRNLMCPKFLSICGLFSLSYLLLITKSCKSESEILRVAGAGSLSFLICELAFYPMDALNLQQKLNVNKISMPQMLRIVYKNFGPYGIYRGFSTSYYSSTTAGYAFFAMYKGIKVKLKEVIKPKNQAQCSAIYMFSSAFSEMMSMLIYYPYEIIKVRYVAKNDSYKYKGITDGFRNIVKEQGVLGLYKGYSYFLTNYILSYNLQLVIYETYMDLKKKRWGLQEFKKNENRYVIEAALLGGALSGIVMNSFECVMYMRMAEQDASKSMRRIYAEQGAKLFTKGLGTRIAMTQGYGLLQFNTLFYLGKAFDCDLLDETDDEFLESLPE